jgi:C1A family cysteine protease
MLKLLPPRPPKYHWKREPVDTRDHTYDPQALGARAPTLSSSVDLRNYCSPIENQGQLGSCTGNAIAGLIEYLDRKANKNLDVSRLFIYYQERLLEGTVNYDAGAYIRDGIKAVNKYGAPLESLWPYLITRYATTPSRAAYADALKRRAGAYQKITTRVAGVKTALSQGYPVVIGFDVYESFEGAVNNTTGMMPYPAAGEQLLGGHAVAIVGYNDTLGGGRFICRNSWGTSWGDRGYFYMPYQVIANANMSDDFWIITSVTNP